MPTVLAIAYFFPPMGGAGVQRTLKFIKYLPEFNWRVHVLTVRVGGSLQDPSLAFELSDDLPITRTTSMQLPQHLPWRLKKFINRWFLIVDEQIGWLPFATTAGKKLIKENAIQAIYSTSAPYTAHLVARQLHRQFKLPWVADFRDPWLENQLIKFPTAIHRNINEGLEKSVFNEADRVILNTNTSCDRYRRKYHSLPANRMISIPNGYDEADLPIISQPIRADSIFTVVHIGSLYQKTRSSEFFLEALGKAIQDNKIPADKIRIRFIGNIDKETRGLVRQFNLDDNIEILGYLPHRQALEEMYTADLLLLIPSYGSGSELFVPAKLYEYLPSRKPILCLAEPGACADLILRAGSGYIVSPTDPLKIAEKLVEMYRRWARGELVIDPNMDLISTFERRKLTSQLANLLTEVCA